MPVLKGAGQWNPWSSIGSGLGGLTTMLANYYGNKDEGMDEETKKNMAGQITPPPPINTTPSPSKVPQNFVPFDIGSTITAPQLGGPVAPPGPVPLGGVRPPKPSTLSLDQILAMFGISGGGGGRLI